jgi:hypothetical protein
MDIEKQSTPLPKKLVTAALTILVLCWVAFIAINIASQDGVDLVQMLIMLVLSSLVIWLVVSNNPKEYEIDAIADGKAEGSTPSTTLSVQTIREDDDKDSADKDSADKDSADKDSADK